MSAFLILALLQQGPDLEVSTHVDRDHLAVGEEFLFTVRGHSRSAGPLRFVVPPISGLETISRSERSEVAYRATQSRTSVLDIRFRAVTPGRWRLGPVRVRQGDNFAEAEAIQIEVVSSVGTVTAALNPRVQRLLDAAPAPLAPGKVALTLVLSAESALVGEQVDLLTAAWFPRELRLQLRRPPTLQPPSINGVWSHPQPTPVGIAASRLVAGQWYDLFIVHQIVFPIAQGEIKIAPAALQYSVPLAFQFFSQEERHALKSASPTLQAVPLPDSARPRDFAGAVGRGLSVERLLTPAAGRQGEPLSVDITVKGEGNVALWPAPRLSWPRSVRAYPEGTDERLLAIAGRLGGTKTFRYLLVPDSAGTFQLPALSYTFFDLESLSYQRVGAASSQVAVAAGPEAAIARALPPPLLNGHEPAAAWLVVRASTPLIWGTVLLLPPLIALAAGLVHRPRRAKIKPVRPRAARAPLRDAERELDAVLAVLAPDWQARENLTGALRAAGMHEDIANKVAQLKERLGAHCFGPERERDPGDLVTEVRRAVQELGLEAARMRRRRLSAKGSAAVLIGVIALGSAHGAQRADPHRMYEAGALRAAAGEFTRLAAHSPQVASYWYNLGATYYRLGHDGRAAAAWMRAKRLEPRNAIIRRAIQLTPPPDRGTALQLWTAPITPEELLVISAGLWVAGWLALALWRRRRGIGLTLLLAGCVLGGSSLGLRSWYRRPVALILETTTLRISPHDRGPAVGILPPGTAVLVVRLTPRWVLARSASGHSGWISAEALATL